jgi:RND family efflux transporter MFP subunit
MLTKVPFLLVSILAALVAGCFGTQEGHDHGDGNVHSHDSHEASDTWSVTSWGNSFEIFAEAGMLAVGEVSTSHTHVTVLGDFSPLAEGRVSAILRAASGTEAVFTQEKALRPGIFSIDIAPTVDGEFALIFRVEAGGLVEDIPSGKVYVGIPAEPGMLTEAPLPPNGAAIAAAAGTPPVGFLKEQQWKTRFATAWISDGVIRSTVDGFAKVRSAAGSDVIVSAPTNGILSASTKLHAGMRVREGEELLKLLPRAVSEQSLSELRSELAFERLRLARLEKLLAIGGVTEEDVDQSRSRVTALEPLVEGNATSGSLSITSPISGLVADVWVRPGMSAAAGDSLVRLVKTNSVWLEVSLDAAEMAALDTKPRSLHLRIPGSADVLSYSADEFRLIATSPSLDPVTGNGTALLELTVDKKSIPLGVTVEASIGTGDEETGVVVDANALVDDGGTDVVYVQTEGESFERHEVHVIRREGGRVLITGLAPGVRVVTQGGPVIRRASMLSTGGIEGHVH